MTLMSLWRNLQIIIYLVLITLLLGGSTSFSSDPVERVRAFTRSIEFDYTSWTLDALGVKLGQVALDPVRYMPERVRSNTVISAMTLAVEIQQDEAQLDEIYSDPNIKDPQIRSAGLREELDGLYARRSQLGPVAESILQDQLAETIAKFGLTLGGQPIPPILYHSTPLPSALIVSPREVIRQDADISLNPGLTTDQRDALEKAVDKTMNVSSLVVGIGGIGLYPTMVMQTSDLNWLSEVVAHEWTHNYLTMRPLGVSYLNSPELRTMNETVAAISGKEIGRAMMEEYYPELVPPPPPGPPPPSAAPATPSEPPVFNFNAEMRVTRETVDQLLAEGKVTEAEGYMEARRVFFWNHGYQIRKLNQAYFAFYGAYADQPGGAAGEDPVGAAVRALRAQSPSLADFLNRISWMNSFEQLKRAVGG